jgi:DNA-binding transcriptional ArsR family regulator
MDHHSVRLDAVFQALADPTRRAVLGRLGQGPAPISELAAPFDMALPSFLKHIRQLEQSGLIRTRKRGRVRTCTLERKQFAVVDTWLARQRAIWQGRADRLAEIAEAAHRRESLR